MFKPSVVATYIETFIKRYKLGELIGAIYIIIDWYQHGIPIYAYIVAALIVVLVFAKLRFFDA